jgi:glycosyltransferase involved in cell wall biosynthesis
MGQLRIAYLGDVSPLDRNAYSGGTARIYDSLCKHAGEVTILPVHWAVGDLLRRALERVSDSNARALRWWVQVALRQAVADRVEAALARGDYDVLFCAQALPLLAGLRVPTGVVTAYTSDTLHSFPPHVGDPDRWQRSFARPKRAAGWVERREQRALRKLDLAFWPTQWLSDTAVARFQPGERKDHVVPWGSKLKVSPSKPQEKLIHTGGPLEILFIGRDWAGQGGPLLSETVTGLRARGVDALLTVIGCRPPDAALGEHVAVFPALDPADPQYAEVLRSAHFLVVPSVPGYGFALCDAAAFGVPSLSFCERGAPIREGVNGHLLLPGSGSEDLVDVILSYVNAPGRYAALSLSTRQEYTERLNWDAWGRAVTDQLGVASAIKQWQGD